MLLAARIVAPFRRNFMPVMITLLLCWLVRWLLSGHAGERLARYHALIWHAYAKPPLNLG